MISGRAVCSRESRANVNGDALSLQSMTFENMSKFCVRPCVEAVLAMTAGAPLLTTDFAGLEPTRREYFWVQYSGCAAWLICLRCLGILTEPGIDADCLQEKMRVGR